MKINSFAQNRIAGPEIIAASLLFLIGVSLLLVHFDYFDTNRLISKLVLWAISIVVCFGVQIFLLRISALPFSLCCAGAMWSTAVLHFSHFDQVVYFGSVFLLLEILCAGVALSIRTGLATWTAVLVTIPGPILAFYLNSHCRAGIFRTLGLQ